MNAFVIFGVFLLSSTSVLANIQTVSPSANKQLVSCTIETLVWTDDGSIPSLEQIGMVDVNLMQGGSTVQTLATLDALMLSAAVLLPCDLPSASDYRMEYSPHSSEITVRAEVGVYRRVTANDGLPTSLPMSTTSHHGHKSKSATVSSSSTSTSGNVDRDFDLLTPEAPMVWTTSTSTSSTPATTYMTPRPTLDPPTQAYMANRAVPSREVGVHPGLIIMWVGVMCSMLML